ncbi:Flp pilus assembly protein CpaB [Nocardioides marmoribigeumensis]|uniref:Pilus assembly protein CpaB n=1 Tax=Nocardioides marmoribigeumensis TaxID=433649 RepID=A0ABU2BT66_9ACTN|nr:Flp pilus assembly protein CpaB [Nocardioides marmoribigeumensis]MDR7360544.1 pilus assembly protein CpaB [Nocardioides marmoribigeumensis]
MGRRTVILIVALLIAVVGSAMVFIYVQGADKRAEQKQDPVKVLKAVAQIEPGESLAKAQAAGKLNIDTVPREDFLEGAITSVGDNGTLVALSRVFPGEQITLSKFGAVGEQDPLAMPEGQFAISVNLSDTGRVAGFVSPGSNVAVFMNGPIGAQGQDGTRLLLPKVQVIAVGATTVTTSTTTAESGTQTTETLPRTLFTLAVDQKKAEKLMYASTHGELSFGLLTDKSKVSPDSGTTQANLFR